VARVSRSASTGPPRLDVGFATPILDALLHLSHLAAWGRKLRPLGIGHLVHNCPNLEALSASGQRIIRGELTRAGQKLEDHQGEGNFPMLRGGDRMKSQMGQEQLDDILTDPGTRTEPITAGNFKGGTYFIAPDGRGASFDPSGEFQYFGVFR